MQQSDNSSDRVIIRFGDLVITDDGYHGIVMSRENETHVSVYCGNGLEMLLPRHEVKPASERPGNFAEIIVPILARQKPGGPIDGGEFSATHLRSGRTGDNSGEGQASS